MVVEAAPEPVVEPVEPEVVPEPEPEPEPEPVVVAPEPVVAAPAPKPEPMSNPFEAGKLSIPFARSASRRSKTGSPQPTGTPRATKDAKQPVEAKAASVDSEAKSDGFLC